MTLDSCSSGVFCWHSAPESPLSVPLSFGQHPRPTTGCPPQDLFSLAPWYHICESNELRECRGQERGAELMKGSGAQHIWHCDPRDQLRALMSVFSFVQSRTPALRQGKDPIYVTTSHMQSLANLKESKGQFKG